MMLLGGQTTEFLMNAILPIGSYTNGVGFPIQFAFRPKATPFAGKTCETNCLLVRTESCWKTRGTVLLYCLQPSRKFQHGTYECESGTITPIAQTQGVGYITIELLKNDLGQKATLVVFCAGVTDGSCLPSGLSPPSR